MIEAWLIFGFGIIVGIFFGYIIADYQFYSQRAAWLSKDKIIKTAWAWARDQALKDAAAAVTDNQDCDPWEMAGIILKLKGKSNED